MIVARAAQYAALLRPTLRWPRGGRAMQTGLGESALRGRDWLRLVGLGVLAALAVQTAAEEASMSMTITSSAFAQNGSIPKQYTCEGKDISPPLAWSGAPANAKSLVLIVDDPDAPDPAAPRMTWVHWVVYNLPAASTGSARGGEGAARRHARGAQRLAAHRLRRALSARRPAPLLSQALRAGQLRCRTWASRPSRSWNRR